jgi:hypothetical protein
LKARELSLRKNNHLSEHDSLFLDTLLSFDLDYVSEKNLKLKLFEVGFNEDSYTQTKRKLLFRGYIGSIYGNITLEKKAMDEKNM